LCLLIGIAPSTASSDRSTFEAGFDGWESTEVYRTETDIFGGGYAMFGYDGSRMWKVFDLAGADHLKMDTYFTGSEPELSDEFVAVVARRQNSQGMNVGDLIVVGSGESLLATDQNPMPNPDRRRYDLSSLDGAYEVQLLWLQRACIPEDPGSCFEIHYPGFVDNVTVPEPSSVLGAGASVLSLATLVRLRLN
jgi:hypothetical protein